MDKRQWIVANKAGLQPYKEYLSTKYIDIRESDLNNVHDERLSLVAKGKAQMLKELISELELKQENI